MIGTITPVYTPVHSTGAIPPCQNVLMTRGSHMIPPFPAPSASRIKFRRTCGFSGLEWADRFCYRRVGGSSTEPPSMPAPHSATPKLRRSFPRRRGWRLWILFLKERQRFLCLSQRMVCQKLFLPEPKQDSILPSESFRASSLASIHGQLGDYSRSVSASRDAAGP